MIQNYVVRSVAKPGRGSREVKVSDRGWLVTSSIPVPLKTAIYTRAFGDGPRNFEPWSRTTPELAPPLLTTTPHQREDVSALGRFNVHRCPTRLVLSGTGIELVTKPATIRYLYHSATAASFHAKARALRLD
ncbi:uncharacterized protein TNCV_287701 [Trichonephila clavipes]|nr:uncharacterized protein TNCV_287701 [Trichonephila clavipes]